jgi:hypothetical protein
VVLMANGASVGASVLEIIGKIPKSLLPTSN